MNRLLTHLRSKMSAADFQQYCEDFITACAIGAVLLLGWAYYGQAAGPVAESPPAEPVSCAGRKECHTQVFLLDNDRRAYCAIWANDQSHCVVETR